MVVATAHLIRVAGKLGTAKSAWEERQELPAFDEEEVGTVNAATAFIVEHAAELDDVLPTGMLSDAIDVLEGAGRSSQTIAWVREMNGPEGDPAWNDRLIEAAVAAAEHLDQLAKDFHRIYDAMS